jgi:hypothetical protein
MPLGTSSLVETKIRRKRTFWKRSPGLKHGLELVLPAVLSHEILDVGSSEKSKLRAEWAEDAVSLETVVCAASPGHQRAGRRLGRLSVDLPFDFYGEVLPECCYDAAFGESRQFDSVRVGSADVCRRKDSRIAPTNEHPESLKIRI